MDDILKTKGIIYLNVESWLLFAPPNQNFWLRTWTILSGPWSASDLNKILLLFILVMDDREKYAKDICFPKTNSLWACQQCVQRDAKAWQLGGGQTALQWHMEYAWWFQHESS